jgi:hypothetical protein
MVRQECNIRILNHLTQNQVVLNTTLADILSLCDGSMDVDTLVNVLDSHYADSQFSRTDVFSGLDQLLEQDLISFKADGSSRAMICVSFQGFAQELDVLDNYFTCSLSYIESVLIVDPSNITPDIHFVLQETESFFPERPKAINENTAIVQIACYGIKADFERFDFSITSNLIDSENEQRHMCMAIQDCHDPIFTCHHYSQILPLLVRPDHCAQKIDTALFQGGSGQIITSVGKKLTIGMATYDDYDGVYFSIQSIRLFHPEVLEHIEFLILDNHPKGGEAETLKALATAISGVKYLPFCGATGTAVRELLFQYADTDWVLCMDSHVMLAPRVLQRLLDYIDGLDNCTDLLQGPLMDDQFNEILTHFEPKWHDGMHGAWATDERGLDENAEPFEIGMQGLGLFVCHKDAWPGLNPDFHGFGGEEGYLHEKFRRAGGRTLCLPFLRWIHRFGRPHNPPYEITWEDRIRNYLLGHKELGWDIEPVLRYFSEVTDSDTVQGVERSIKQSEFG